MPETRLDALLSATRARIAGLKPHAAELERRAAAAPAPPSLARALGAGGGGVTVGGVAEVKRRAPSAGSGTRGFDARKKVHAGPLGDGVGQPDRIDLAADLLAGD